MTYQIANIVSTDGVDYFTIRQATDYGVNIDWVVVDSATECTIFNAETGEVDNTLALCHTNEMLDLIEAAGFPDKQK